MVTPSLKLEKSPESENDQILANQAKKKKKMFHHVPLALLISEFE